jgi:hypothetical protein
MQLQPHANATLGLSHALVLAIEEGLSSATAPGRPRDTPP